MSNDDIAAAVLECVGGFSNVAGNSLCATRLRITLREPGKVNRNALHSINGILGIADRGTRGIELVFGPNLVRGVYQSFERLTGIFSDDHATERRRHSSGNFQVKITPETPGAPQVKSVSARGTTEEIVPAPTTVDDDDTNALLEMLDESSDDLDELETDEVDDGVPRPCLLVINGPNINFYGVHGPVTSPTENYPALLELCRQSAETAGFASCECYQSNHIGDLIDFLQDSHGVADALVINAGGYAYTSLSLLDAVVQANIPAIEVQLDRIAPSEGLPWQSYVGRACLATITGQGIQGYRTAIMVLAHHLNLG